MSLWKANSMAGTWWQPHLWVSLSNWGGATDIFWVMARWMFYCVFCGSCTIWVCPSGQSLKMQRNKYKSAINETFNERKRRQQTRTTRSSWVKTLQNNASVSKTEKCHGTGYKCWKVLSSLKRKHNEDFPTCKDVTSGLEKINCWQLRSISV